MFTAEKCRLLGFEAVREDAFRERMIFYRNKKWRFLFSVRLDFSVRYMLVLSFMCIVVSIIEFLVIIMHSLRKGYIRRILQRRAAQMDPFMQTSVGLTPGTLRERSVDDLKQKFIKIDKICGSGYIFFCTSYHRNGR